MAIVPLALVRPRAGTAGSLDVPNLPRIPTQCEPYPFTWTGGIPPYTFSVISPRAPPDSVFPNIQGTSFTWRADIPATFSVSFKVEDGAGNVAQTSAVTVRRGVDSSCLNDSAESGQTTSTSSTADSPPSTTPASPTPSTTPQDPNTSSATFPLPPQSPAPSESSPNTDPRSTSISDVQSTGDARTSGATAPPLSTSLGASNTFPTPSETKSDSIQASGPSDHVSAVSTSVQSNAGSLGSLTHSHTSAIDPSFTASGDPPGSPKPSNLNPGKHSLNVGAIVGIVLGALVLVLAIVLIIRRRRKRRKARDALRPDAFTPNYSVSSTRVSRPSLDIPKRTTRESLRKSSRFSTSSTELTDLRSPLTVSSADAVLTQSAPSSIAIDTHSPASPSSNPLMSEHSKQTPRNVIQDVLQALRDSSALETPVEDGAPKNAQAPTPPPSTASPRRRERSGGRSGRGEVQEEDGGVRLAGGPADEPPDPMDLAVLPPPYRRY